MSTRRLVVIVEPGRIDRREPEALPQFPGPAAAGLTAREGVALPHPHPAGVPCVDGRRARGCVAVTADPGYPAALRVDQLNPR